MWKWKLLLKIDQLSDLGSLLHYRISNVKKKLMHSTNFSLGTLVVADCWSQDTDSIRKDNDMHKWNSTEYLKREEFVTCNVTTKSLIYYLQSRCPDPSGQAVNYEAALRLRRTGSCLTFNLRSEILPFLPQVIIRLSKLLSCEMPDQS